MATRVQLEREVQELPDETDRVRKSNVIATRWTADRASCRPARHWRRTPWGVYLLPSADNCL